MPNPFTDTKILVVDDEKLWTMTTCAKLKNAGASTASTTDIHEAARMVMQNPGEFNGVVVDVMMGDVDGFMLRKIIHGIDPNIPILFLTALDPADDPGLLMRILSDANSYYLPKTVKTEVLLKRVERMVAGRRSEQQAEDKKRDNLKSLELAANIQKSMLPVRTLMTNRGCYSSWWRPAEVVSGDLYESMPFGEGCRMFILGDIRGHGTSAAMAMTAVLSFLKQIASSLEHQTVGPSYVANLLQGFFRSHMADVTYMTALICVHRPLTDAPDKEYGPNEIAPGEVRWISCGAPDLVVVDGGSQLEVNPEHRGGLPIGLMSGTVYSADDEVRTFISDTAVCVMYSDGILDFAKDAEGVETLTAEKAAEIGSQLATIASEDASLVALPAKFMAACEAEGYDNQQDDMTVFTFGDHREKKGTYERTIPLSKYDINHATEEVAEWCRAEGWKDALVEHVRTVLKDKLSDIRARCLTAQDRMQEVVSFRLRMRSGMAALTVWDYVPPISDGALTPPQMKQRTEEAALRRQEVRELCSGVERSHYSGMNETVYYIPPE